VARRECAVQRLAIVLACRFVPSQQGTIRPLSERLFFIAFWHMFGWQAVYYRAMVFATQFFNLILLASIIWKLTGSRAAAFLAPVLWIVNASLAVCDVLDIGIQRGALPGISAQRLRALPQISGDRQVALLLASGKRCS